MIKAVVVGLAVTASVPGWSTEARYLLEGGQAPAAVVSNGYVQTVTSVGDGRWRVSVSVSFEPVGADGVWSARTNVPLDSVPSGFRFPAGLREALVGEIDPWRSATTVLAWVADHVAVDDDDTHPQDAASVLRRERGRCSGIANAATALLQTAGFEARTVSGLLVDEGTATPHRWLEVGLPSAGWVPTDPTLGLWVMSPHHVAFPDAVLDPPRVVIERAAPSSLGRLPRWDGRPVRPNHGADLICRMADGGPAVATLTDRYGDVRRAVLAPEGRFDRLLPGVWKLEVERVDRVIAQAALTLREGQVHHYMIETARSAEAH
jgi:hypothetical protein